MRAIIFLEIKEMAIWEKLKHGEIILPMIYCWSLYHITSGIEKALRIQKMTYVHINCPMVLFKRVTL